MTLAEALRAKKLLKGRGRITTLLRACHGERLVGGLSVSLAALPDEVIGPLTHAMGGAATKLKVYDARGTRPMELEIASGDVHEKWEVEDVASLVHNLNDLFRDDETVRLTAVLGEWEDATQLWSLGRDDLRALLETRWFEARNASALQKLLSPREEEWS